MATISIEEPALPYRGPAFLAAGFRPFFLFAAVQAAVMLPVWLAVWTGGLVLAASIPPAVWHGHAMVFGFGGAAVAGFLLTAVPNWTNSRPVAGAPLAVLFGLWLAARVSLALAGWVPLGLGALFELSWLPVLAFLVGRPLVKAGKARNLMFLAVLAAFWLADALTMAGFLGGGPDPLSGVYTGIAVLLVLIVIVGGRVIPSFTQTWLAMQGRPSPVRSIGWIENGGVQGMTAVAGLLAAWLPGAAATGAALLAAAVLNAIRLSRWHSLRTLPNPILWVLHLGYLWLVLGLALLGVTSFTDALPASAAVHALTAGAIATMVVGVMSRAALGHSGRPLQVHGLTVAAYVLISLGAILRVAAPLAGGAVVALTHAGGSLWALGWLCFIAVYAPIVVRPRADGRAG